ncbi:arrestin domain-containing protein A-like isoform X1 [Acropora palmata]|uniref:arrestin domain-containing protein A-like isoform X1 n=1 Tax=Acropora palmata TaxID=6131 RepID=UPI003DA14ED7
MSMNRIAVRTNKGDYLGGEGVYGVVYLWICGTDPCREVKLKFKGYEKCEWEYREVQQDEATQMPVTIVKTKQSRRDMFRAELTLIEYPGGIPMGCYAYPFHYTLQQGLPVSFNNSGNQANGDHWKAKISYKVEAEVDSPDSGEVLKACQHITVNEHLPLTPLEPEVITARRSVKICCCIPKGDILLNAWLGKKVYASGESAVVHVEVKNNSNVDIESFTVKLIRVVNLKPQDREFSGSFSSQDSRPSVAQAIRVPVIIDTITEKSHNRSQDQQLRNAEIPLDLWEAVTRIEFEPSTNGQIVKSKYHVDVEVDIPWALPISVQLPVTLRAPANHSWSDWEPPPWVFNCRVVKISGPCAVPEHLLGSKMFANIPGIQADPF